MKKAPVFISGLIATSVMLAAMLVQAQTSPMA